MKDSVELCQRSGRARQQDSSIVILDERPDRPLTALETARDLQTEIVEQYNPAEVLVSETNGDAERQKQMNRERNASKTIFGSSSSAGGPLSALNIYVKKTKASLSENYRGAGGLFQCTLTYKTILRTVQVVGRGSSKKAAKKDSASALLEALKAQTGSK